MADEKIITSSVFEQGVTEIMQDIANNLYEFEEYTEEEVADLMDLSEEEVAELTRVINDTTVALNKVYSNKKVEDLLTELEITCNKYADEKICGIANIHLAYVDTLPATGEDNVIYILKSTTGGNDTLNLYNNGWISIGEFAISLDNYYDKTEIDALLNDKANVNETISQDDVVSDMSNISSSTVLSTAGLEVELNKKANLDDMTTELDKKVDKDGIVTVLDNTVTDEQVASARVVVDELGLKANDSEVVKKTDITTTLDNTVTNEQVPSAKAVNTLLNNKANKMLMKTSQNVDDLVDEGSYYVIEGRNAPHAYGWIDVLANTNYTIQLFYPSITTNCEMYIRRRQAGVWGSWQKVCTTTVADVTKTNLPVNSWASGSVYYSVKNGICFVIVNALKSATMSTQNQTIVTGLPKPMYNNEWYNIAANHRDYGSMLVNISGGNLINYIGSDNVPYYGAFSYPVAE